MALGKLTAAITLNVTLSPRTTLRTKHILTLPDIFGFNLISNNPDFQTLSLNFTSYFLG